VRRAFAAGSVLALALGLGVGLVLGRGGSRHEAAPPRAAPAPPAARRLAPPPPPRVRAPRCPAGAERALGDGKLAFAAYVRTKAVAYRSPGRRPLATFGRLNVNRFPSVFGVVGAIQGSRCEAVWYRVQLPLRPNGAVGYVRGADVRVERVAMRLEIDLSARRLTLYRAGRPVLRAAVAIGKPATPTPLGRYYVNQRLLAANPRGAYGPAALGISAFSDVLTHWAQGGPIGIHGTNEPWLVGQAASNGCIRLRNAEMTRLFAQVPAGTPVIIGA
jgi:hypothetical protein